MRRVVAASAALLLAFLLAALSVRVQRVGPEVAVVGNLCGARADQLCYQKVRSGGFPLPYLFDRPGVSVPDQLGLGEDDFRPGAFVLDVLFYVAALAALGLAYRRRAGRRR